MKSSWISYEVALQFAALYLLLLTVLVYCCSSTCWIHIECVYLHFTVTQTPERSGLWSVTVVGDGETLNHCYNKCSCLATRASSCSWAQTWWRKLRASCSPDHRTQPASVTAQGLLCWGQKVLTCPKRQQTLLNVIQLICMTLYSSD